MPHTVSTPYSDPVQAEEVRPYLNQILNSEPFRKTPNLRQLLEYLVTQKLEGHTDQLKESVIAIEVFGRRTSFDGRLDNIVRVQAHRLRKLLETYYAEEGARDRLKISVPRGGYVPHFIVSEDPAAAPVPAANHVSTSIVEDPTLTAAVESVPHVSPSRLSRRFPMPAAAVACAAFLVGGLISYVLLRASRTTGPAPDKAIAEIWDSIFEPGVRVIVSYTNPAFLRVGRSRTYLMYQGPLSAPAGTQINISDTDPAIDPQYTKAGAGPLFFSDGWTGTGEVLGVNRLTELSGQFGGHLAVIPSRALALNEVRAANVIFLGSPWMNGILAQIGNEATPIYNTNDGRIIIRTPRSGEQRVYENIKDPATSEMKASFALFSVLPGVDAARKVVSSAGLGTGATWGAVDYMTTPAGAARVASVLKAANGGKLPVYYQAIIRTEMVKGAASHESFITACPVDLNKR